MTKYLMLENQNNIAVGYPVGSISNFAIGYTPELSVITGAAHTAIGGNPRQTVDLSDSIDSSLKPQPCTKCKYCS